MQVLRGYRVDLGCRAVLRDLVGRVVRAVLMGLDLLNIKFLNDFVRKYAKICPNLHIQAFQVAHRNLADRADPETRVVPAAQQDSAGNHLKPADTVASGGQVDPKLGHIFCIFFKYLIPST